MQLISKQISGYLERSSWIRKMFEAGIALKKEYGENAVCDFSLGNPDLPAPAAVKKTMLVLAEKADQPLFFGYMPNGGYPSARETLAQYLSKEQETKLSQEHLILNCGAAGAINAFLRSVLNPEDEVLAIAPYFVEYGFYVENHQGIFKTVKSNPKDFTLNLENIAAAITPKTRAIIINSPNNPCGQVYNLVALKNLVALLREKSDLYGRPIFLISDEPYRFLTFDGVKVPAILPLYDYAVIAGSFSKNLGLAGERIGYLAVAPTMPNYQELINALILSNRILGFVNPPSIGQKLMAAALGTEVDTAIYAQRKEVMADVLKQAGINFFMPKGAFYFFPEVPENFANDDVAFVDALKKELILAVPGSGFGFSGYFRLTFCMDKSIIARSAEGFCRAVRSK